MDGDYLNPPYCVLAGGSGCALAAGGPNTTRASHAGSRPCSCRTSVKPANTPDAKPSAWSSHDTAQSVGARPHSNPTWHVSLLKYDSRGSVGLFLRQPTNKDIFFFKSNF